MTLASLVAAGADQQEVMKSLQKLDIAFDLAFEAVEVNGIGALQAEVSYPHEHAHRNFGEISAMISAAGLPHRASNLAIKAFRRLAEAEGKVHGKPPEEVTFHEVGAIDSIVDIVGSCIALDMLGVDSVSCGLLPMGGGVVRAAHGSIPVPGPATLEVLKGSVVEWPDIRREMTTPTGAALMWAFTDGVFTNSPPPMTLKSAGYGAGTARYEERPNILRAVVGEIEGEIGELVLIETNVDDAGGEKLGFAVESLLEQGALDAWLEPVTMKKSRGAYKLCAIVKQADKESTAHRIMRETGSLGVRHHAIGRTVAERRIEEVQLPYGECRVKIGSIGGEDYVVSPEYEDAVRLARREGIPLVRVYRDAADLYEKR